MPEETNVNETETPTDDTNGGENTSTEETAVDDTTETQETSETKEETTEESEQSGAPEEYAEFKLPDGYEMPESNRAAIVELGKEFNLTYEQAQKMVDKFIEVTKSNADAHVEAYLKEHDDMLKGWDETLKKEWGDNHKNNTILVNKVLGRFTKSEELKDFMLGKPAEGSTERPPINPLLGNFLLEIGKVMSSDTLETGELPRGGNRNLSDMFSDLNK